MKNIKLGKALILSVLLSSVTGCGNEEYFTITFNTYSAIYLEPIKVKANSKIDKPDDPVIHNHDFLYWEYRGHEWDFDYDRVTQSMTLDATYRQVAYDVEVECDEDYQDYLSVSGAGNYSIDEGYTISVNDNIDKHYMFKLFRNDGKAYYRNNTHFEPGDSYIYVEGLKSDVLSDKYYDANGNISRIFEDRSNKGENNIEYKYNYDGSNRLIEESTSSDDILLSKNVYQYNGNTTRTYEHIIESGVDTGSRYIDTTYNEDGRISNVTFENSSNKELISVDPLYTFYENGLLESEDEIVVKDTYYEKYHNVYTYNGKRLVKEKLTTITYHGDVPTSLVGTTVNLKTVNTYDFGLNLIQMDFTNSRGLVESNHYTYNGDKLVYSECEDRSGSLCIWYTNYYYDGDALLYTSELALNSRNVFYSQKTYFNY